LTEILTNDPVLHSLRISCERVTV